MLIWNPTWRQSTRSLSSYESAQITDQWSISHLSCVPSFFYTFSNFVRRIDLTKGHNSFCNKATTIVRKIIELDPLTNKQSHREQRQNPEENLDLRHRVRQSHEKHCAFRVLQLHEDTRAVSAGGSSKGGFKDEKSLGWSILKSSQKQRLYVEKFASNWFRRS